MAASADSYGVYAKGNRELRRARPHRQLPCRQDTESGIIGDLF